MTPSLAEATSAMLRDHIASEERDLKQLTTQVAKLLERSDRAAESHATMILAINKLDGGHINHEARITEIERTVRQAAVLAKWFFGGGLVAVATSLYLFWGMVQSLSGVLAGMK